MTAGLLTCPQRLVRFEFLCIDGLAAELAGRRSGAESGGQFGITIVSGAGGRYGLYEQRIHSDRTVLDRFGDHVHPPPRAAK